jgi:integrase
MGRSEGTLHHVATKAGNLVEYLPAHVAEIDLAAVEKYVDRRLADWVVAPEIDADGNVLVDGRHVRRTTVKKELRILKAALKRAKKLKLYVGDPSDVIPEIDDDAKEGERALTPLELVGLCTALPPKRAAMIVFSVATSAEWSVLCRARREDVAEDLSFVHLRGTKRKTRDRYMPLASPMLRSMVAWSLARANAEGLLFDAWQNVRRDTHDACTKLGIAPCSPNDWRRTFGRWLRASAVEPQIIGAAMGHADSRMVERVYGKLTPDALQKLLVSRIGSEGAAIHSPLAAQDSAFDSDSPKEPPQENGLKIPVSAVRFRPWAQGSSQNAERAEDSPLADAGVDSPESADAQPISSTAPGIAKAAQGLAALRAVDDGYERFVAEASGVRVPRRGAS